MKIKLFRLYPLIHLYSYWLYWDRDQNGAPSMKIRLAGMAFQVSPSVSTCHHSDFPRKMLPATVLATWSCCSSFAGQR